MSKLRRLIHCLAGSVLQFPWEWPHILRFWGVLMPSLLMYSDSSWTSSCTHIEVSVDWSHMKISACKQEHVVWVVPIPNRCFKNRLNLIWWQMHIKGDDLCQPCCLGKTPLWYPSLHPLPISDGSYSSCYLVKSWYTVGKSPVCPFI